MRQQVNEKTTLIYELKKPALLLTTDPDLDRAYDDACEYVGEQLGCGSWEEKRGGKFQMEVWLQENE